MCPSDTEATRARHGPRGRGQLHGVVKDRRRAFSLVGLLLVIAILPVLASMLFPVFSRARSRAQQAACTSNMCQPTMAFLMCAEDSSELLPLRSLVGSGPVCKDPPSGSEPYTRDTQMLPYVHNFQPLLWPENPHGRDKRSSAEPRYINGVSRGAPPAPDGASAVMEKGPVRQAYGPTPPGRTSSSLKAPARGRCIFIVGAGALPSAIAT